MGQDAASGNRLEVPHQERRGREATFKFLALFADENACRAAYLAETGKAGDDPPRRLPTATTAMAATISGRAPFIRHLLGNSFDLEKTKTACRSQKIITDAIDVDSSEFAEIVAEALAAGGK